MLSSWLGKSTWRGTSPEWDRMSKRQLLHAMSYSVMHLEVNWMRWLQMAHRRATPSTTITFPITWSIQVRGVTLQAAISARALHVHAETSTIQSLVQFRKQCVGTAGLVETPEKRAAPLAGHPDDDMDGNIDGKVLWLSAQKGWMVVYVN